MRDLNSFPELDWAKVDQDLLLEGIFMFGGQTANGEATGELYVLRATKKGIYWQHGSTLCKGKGPEARFDHTLQRLRDNLVVFGGRDRT